jgi:hypothetical protein
LIKELGIGNSPDNPTYTPTTLTKEEILNNHGFRLCSFGISTNYKELDLWLSNLSDNELEVKVERDLDSMYSNRSL